MHQHPSYWYRVYLRDHVITLMAPNKREAGELALSEVRSKLGQPGWSAIPRVRLLSWDGVNKRFTEVQRQAVSA